MAKPETRRLRGRAVAAGLVLASLTGCPTQNYEEPKRPRATTDVEDQFAAVESSEWFFATSGVAGNRKRQCEHVRSWVLGENQCQGASCRHGSRLASDWLKECKNLNPKAAQQIEQLQVQLEERAERPETRCDRQLENMLRDGCRNDTNCEQHAQEWATRCGSTVGTPLVIVMLEQVIEQTMARPHEVSIDPRGCHELATELRVASACKHRRECKAQLKKADRFMQRCRRSESAPLAPDDGLAEVSILHGARRPVEPVVVAPRPEKLSVTHTPLRLQSGMGAILEVCKKRVVDLDGYLEARAACQDGQVAVARLLDGPGRNRTLKVALVPHPDDATFLRRFPSLLVTGEQAAREKRTTSAFVAGLDEAASLAGDPKRATEAVAKVLDVFATHRRWLLGSGGLVQTLSERDGTLTRLFAQLGKAKRRAPSSLLRPDRLIPFVRRAHDLPLADVAMSGQVRIGTITPVATLELNQALPQSLAAYRAALAALEKRAARRRVRADDLDPVAAALQKQSQACVSARSKAASTEQALVSCIFGVEECTEEQVSELQQTLDRAQSDALDAFARATLARASLAPDDSRIPRAEPEEASCADPGW